MAVTLYYNTCAIVVITWYIHSSGHDGLAEPFNNKVLDYTNTICLTMVPVELVTVAS